MSDSFLDHLPSHEREKIRKRIRSPEEYERLRDKVKGPEDLEREMKKSEQMAEVKFRMETEPEFTERLHHRIMEDLDQRGLQAVLEGDISGDATRALENGNFTVNVEAHPQTQEDALVVIPEGNVQDRMPVKPSQSEHYIQSLLSV
ncbi:hypothetical protein FJZ27_02035 [Candidatus Peribacteria bacterium]|nr:hypothetical protein [Candidatus Peribacteria bacterium]